jgi:hypothetical protein
VKCVIDASVAASWFALEADSEAANSLLGSGVHMLAPSLMPVELGNVVWKKVRKGEMTPVQAAGAIEAIGSMVRDLRSTLPLASGALALAIELAHPIYDMIYLQCAIASDSVLVTLDSSLIRRIASTSYARHAIHLSDWTPPA